MRNVMIYLPVLALLATACAGATHTTVREVAVPVEVEVYDDRHETSAERRTRVSHDRVDRMIGGGIAGALIGGYLGAATESAEADSTRASRSARTLEGAVIGAGVGVVAGWLTTRE